MKKMELSGTLARLFDYQRFEGNKKLQTLIDETEARSFNNLSDDDLEWVSAAGEETGPKEIKDGEEDG